MQYYSAVKKRNVVICDTMDGNLKASEINQTEKDEYRDLTYMWNINEKNKNNQAHRYRTDWLLPKVWAGVKRWEKWLKGVKRYLKKKGM